MKISWDIIGHRNVLALLEKHILNGPSHAYLFVGEPNLGKKTTARSFIKALECQDKNKKPCNKCISCMQFEAKTHPDVVFIEKEAPKTALSEIIKKEGEIRIKQIRELKRIISLKPHSSPYKVCFIEEAEKINKEASNALLKILEEPLGNAVFILIAPHTRTLLPTIVSRCEILKFFPVSKKIILEALKNKTSIEKAEEIAVLSGRKPGRAIEILENPSMLSFYKESLKTLLKLIEIDYVERFKEAEKMSKNLIETEKVLNTWLSFFRDLILFKTNNDFFLSNPFYKKDILKYAKKYPFDKIKEIIKAIQDTKFFFASNVNPRLSLESLFLKI